MHFAIRILEAFAQLWGVDVVHSQLGDVELSTWALSVTELNALASGIFLVGLGMNKRILFDTPSLSNCLVFLASKTPDFLKDRTVRNPKRRKKEDRFYTQHYRNTIADDRRTATAARLQVEELRMVGSVGSFGSLGPLGILECTPMKAA